MDIGKEIEDLKKRFASLKIGKDHDKIWAMLSEMYRSIVGGTPDDSGWACSDAEWQTIFEKHMGMTKQEWIEKRERGEI